MGAIIDDIARYPVVYIPIHNEELYIKYLQNTSSVFPHNKGENGLQSLYPSPRARPSNFSLDLDRLIARSVVHDGESDGLTFKFHFPV